MRTATRGRGGITERDWYDVGGGESGWIAPDPRDSHVVYAGSYGNLITRFDARTGTQRNINPWPDNPMGHPASDLKYRFQWSFPIVISPHDPTLIYAGANVMFKIHRRRPKLDAHFEGPDAQRQVPTGLVGRPDHQGQHVDRILRHHFHHQRIADYERL